MEIITNNIVGKKPKIIIKYQEISSTYNSTYDIRYDKRKMRKAFLVGDYSYYVELILYGGKQFCFSVESQQEFVDELIFRISEMKNS